MIVLQHTGKKSSWHDDKLNKKKDKEMTQEERWNIRYQEVMGFIENNKRNPSKHRIEEHDMLNWVKANRKVMNAGKLAEPRFGQFVKLLELSNKYKRVNQWK